MILLGPDPAVACLYPDGAIQAVFEARIALAGFLPWVDAGPGFDLGGTAAPPAVRGAPAVRINQFTWPLGAGRFAVGYFLVAAAGAAALVTASAGGSSPVPLFMGSGKEGAPDLTTNVWLVRYLPIARVVVLGDAAGNTASSGLQDAYLVMVADDRWRWNQVACPDFEIVPGAESPVAWSDCISAVAGALGITITMDDIAAAYLIPDASLNLQGQPAGWVLDALAANVGCRVVVGFDGSVTLQRSDAALAARQADDAAYPDRPLRGGGDGFDAGDAGE